VTHCVSLPSYQLSTLIVGKVMLTLYLTWCGGIDPAKLSIAKFDIPGSSKPDDQLGTRLV